MIAPRKSRVLLAVLIALALGLLLPPYVNVSRWRPRISGAIASALGRDVTVGSVTLRLLPQPGFTLSNFTVADDPSFSAEPVLRADEVTASLRLSSLWRGRLEVARLSLKQPSLNLVRRSDGRWNLEALLMKASQTPTAPTAKPRPEARPRFPYIEADSGRINFKAGAEKKIWALADADFALWLEAEDEWHARLAAHPVRNDANLGSDAGMLRLEGSFQRAARLPEMPLHLRAQMEDAQLGQLSTLIYGRDRGWRGLSNTTLDLAGTPAHLTLSGDARVEQFRRYDITPPDSLTLRAHCVAQWTAATHHLDDIECQLPAGSGELSARGAVDLSPQGRRYDLGLVARDVPLSYATALLRRAKRDLPADLTSEGVVNAAVSARTDATGALQWSGGGATRDARLSSRVLSKALDVGTVQFAVESPASSEVPAKHLEAERASKAPRGADLAAKSKRVPSQQAEQEFDAAIAPGAGVRVIVEQFALPLGGQQAATADAVFTRLGYQVRVSGAAEVQRTLEIAHAVAVPAVAGGATGNASLALRLSGAWAGFQRPLVRGTADLHGVTAAIAGVRGPVTIRSATLNLTPEDAEASDLDVTLGGGAIALSGWLRRPRGCMTPESCPVSFSLHADRLALDDVNRTVNPRLGDGGAEPWYRRIASSSPHPSLLARIHATGHATVGHLLVKTVAADNVTANIDLAPGELRLHGVTAALFGGKLAGEWRAEFPSDGSPARYSGEGTVQRIIMAQLAGAMNDPWATGTVEGAYRVTTSGNGAAELAANTSGALDFRWRDGSLRHIRLASADRAADAAVPALAVRDFRGRMALHAGTFSFSQSRMQTPGGIYLVEGTASRTRELSLVLQPAAEARAAYSISGTLAVPRVVPNPPPAHEAAEVRGGPRPASVAR